MFVFVTETVRIRDVASDLGESVKEARRITGATGDILSAGSVFEIADNVPCPAWAEPYPDRRAALDVRPSALPFERGLGFSYPPHGSANAL